MNAAVATARSNIALVKYWGKQDLAQNLPAVGSLSLTLDALWTRTRVAFDSALAADEMVLDGQRASDAVLARTRLFLDRVRRLAGIRSFASVESANNFPTAAGLASSASGFAALAAAASRAAGLKTAPADLADLARLGSGSAPRSLLGGFVELAWQPAADGPRLELRQVAAVDHWDLRLIIAVCGRGPKAIGSTAGMERTRATSPYFQAWIDSHAQDQAAARAAVDARDLPALGRVMEASCFKMHALAMSASPPLIYWNPVSLAVIQRVWALRDAGLEGYVTIDAGPQVKVLCSAAAEATWIDELERTAGVEAVLPSALGRGVEVEA